jgi:EAL domain-containing protein (putative c-di-GMP-specific phosphodiesterase class I)
MLASSAFSIVYQPVVALRDGGLSHFEALARFGPGVGPAETIELAEQLGLIPEFDLAVSRSVIGVLAKAPKSTRIAVNLSAVSIMDSGFIEQLLRATRKAPGLGRRLIFEITETATLTDLDQANRNLERLRAAGHLVCIDDFGAGASSFAYLSALDVDVVKIDGRYIRNLEVHGRDAVMLKHMVALCRELRVETVAEMIETAESADMARALGFELGQGWFFGEPVPADETLRLLADHGLVAKAQGDGSDEAPRESNVRKLSAA